MNKLIGKIENYKAKTSQDIFGLSLSNKADLPLIFWLTLLLLLLCLTFVVWLFVFLLQSQARQKF